MEKARYYAPELGMFLSEDPVFGNLQDPRSMRKHLYAHGDPVNRWDPMGLSTKFVGQHANSSGGLPGAYDQSTAFSSPNYAEFDWDAYNSQQAGLSYLASADRLSAMAQFRMDTQVEDYLKESLHGMTPASLRTAADILGHFAGELYDPVDKFMKTRVGIYAGAAFAVTATIATAGMVALATPAIMGAMAVVGVPAMMAGLVTMGPSGLMEASMQPFVNVGMALLNGWDATVGDYLGVGSALGGSTLFTSSTIRLSRFAFSQASKGVRTLSARNLAAVAGKVSTKVRGLSQKALGHTKFALNNVKSRIRGNKSKKRCPSCFVGDTPVLMCDGETKAIEEIKAGEWVWSKDAVTKDERCFEAHQRAAWRL